MARSLASSQVFTLAMPVVVTIASFVAPYARHRFCTVGILFVQLAGTHITALLAIQSPPLRVVNSMSLSDDGWPWCLPVLPAGTALFAQLCLTRSAYYKCSTLSSGLLPFG